MAGSILAGGGPGGSGRRPKACSIFEPDFTPGAKAQRKSATVGPEIGATRGPDTLKRTTGKRTANARAATRARFLDRAARLALAGFQARLGVKSRGT